MQLFYYALIWLANFTKKAYSENTRDIYNEMDDAEKLKYVKSENFFSN